MSSSSLAVLSDISHIATWLEETPLEDAKAFMQTHPSWQDQIIGWLESNEEWIKSHVTLGCKIIKLFPSITNDSTDDDSDVDSHFSDVQHKAMNIFLRILSEPNKMPPESLRTLRFNQIVKEATINEEICLLKSHMGSDAELEAYLKTKDTWDNVVFTLILRKEKEVVKKLLQQNVVCKGVETTSYEMKTCKDYLGDSLFFANPRILKYVLEHFDENELLILFQPNTLGTTGLYLYLSSFKKEEGQLLQILFTKCPHKVLAHLFGTGQEQNILIDHFIRNQTIPFVSFIYQHCQKELWLLLIAPLKREAYAGVALILMQGLIREKEFSLFWHIFHQMPKTHQDFLLKLNLPEEIKKQLSKFGLLSHFGNTWSFAASYGDKPFLVALMAICMEEFHICIKIYPLLYLSLKQKNWEGSLFLCQKCPAENLTQLWKNPYKQASAIQLLPNDNEEVKNSLLAFCPNEIKELEARVGWISKLQKACSSIHLSEEADAFSITHGSYNFSYLGHARNLLYFVKQPGNGEQAYCPREIKVPLTIQDAKVIRVDENPKEFSLSPALIASLTSLELPSGFSSEIFSVIPNWFLARTTHGNYQLITFTQGNPLSDIKTFERDPYWFEKKANQTAENSPMVLDCEILSFQGSSKRRFDEGDEDNVLKRFKKSHCVEVTPSIYRLNDEYFKLENNGEEVFYRAQKLRLLMSLTITSIEKMENEALIKGTHKNTLVTLKIKQDGSHEIIDLEELT